MTAPVLRPPVRNLLFQLYGRPLHPELFEILTEHRLRHENYELIVRITPTGHVISWENPDVFLTEVTTSDNQHLPQKRRLLCNRLRQEQSRSLTCAHGVKYTTTFQVEDLTPENYRTVHKEILMDGTKSGLLHVLPKEQPWSWSPLGYVNVEALPGCLFLTCFHTFPDELTVIKTQTLIEKK